VCGAGRAWVQRPSSGIGAWRQTACSDKQRAVPLPLPRRTRMRVQTLPPPPSTPPPPKNPWTHLQQRDVLHHGPAPEAALVAQVAQVVAVAPDLAHQLGPRQRRRGRVLIQRVRVLGQAVREVTQVLVCVRVCVCGGGEEVRVCVFRGGSMYVVGVWTGAVVIDTHTHAHTHPQNTHTHTRGRRVSAAARAPAAWLG
jgi:hypothetical protein